MDEPIIDVVDVWKRFGDSVVLRGVSISVAECEVLCLLGPSGAGKSTLLRCLNNLESYNSGQIRVQGETVGFVSNHTGAWRVMTDRQASTQRSKTGMVFQSFNLFPHLSVLDNVTLGPRKVRGMDSAAAADMARSQLQRVGMLPFAESFPRQLSGGQQQRVAIARALAMDPAVLLFDEPTSALDPELVGEVLTVMRELADSGMTMIIVTHEMRFARDVADRIVLMDQGRIVEDGPPEAIFSGSANERTQRFVSRTLDGS